MTHIVENPNMMVALTQSTVINLLALQRTPDQSLNDIISQLVPRSQAAQKTAGNPVDKGSTKPLIAAPLCNSPTPVIRPLSGTQNAKCKVEVFGERYGANNLGELFGEAVDLINFVDPDTIQRLSECTTKARYHVSKYKEGVHINNPQLATFQTQSGWWISKNVGFVQTLDHFEELCRCAGLAFGEDVRFPV